jgi:upstream activation factor subunit UAF30
MELQTIFDELTALRNEVKSLTKLVRKVRSVQDDPDGEKAAARSKNNGFNRLSEIDSALREFLGLAEGEMIARSEVTKRINAYIKDNNLKHPDNGRVIVMDDKLKKLLSPPEDVQITFLNLQKYISPHYVKAVAPDTPAAPVESAAPAAEEAPKTVKKVVKRPVVRKPAATA